jgi:hypothetical protein
VALVGATGAIVSPDKAINTASANDAGCRAVLILMCRTRARAGVRLVDMVRNTRASLGSEDG